MSALWKELLVELNAVGLERIERGKGDPMEYHGLEPFINAFPDAPLAMLASKVGREELTWLGQKGATPQQIADAEERLGFRFPDSYREFLLESNGFLVPGTYCCVCFPWSWSESSGTTMRRSSRCGRMRTPRTRYLISRM